MHATGNLNRVRAGWVKMSVSGESASETDSDIEELDQAATQMQRVQRGKAARAEYQRDREAVVKVQSMARGHAVRKAQGNAGGGQAGTKTTGVTFVSNPLESAPDDIESGSREASASRKNRTRRLGDPFKTRIGTWER